MKCRSEYDQLEEYFELLKLRGVKADTISRYRSCMVSLFRKMESLGIVVDLKTMKQEDIYRALLRMGLMESSQEAYGYIIKAACRYHMNPNIEGLKVLTNGNRPNVRWITDDQFCQLMGTEDITDKLILHLGGDYGLRRGEIAKLKLGDIRPGYLIVHGKGHGDDGKIRHVPLLADKDPIIEEYLMMRRGKVSRCVEDLSDDHLVIWCDHLTVRAIRAEGIGRRIRKLMLKSDIDATSHSLRREFITSAYRAGNSLVDIMKVVGHTDPTVTMQYIRTDMDVMRCVVATRNEYIANKGCMVVEDEDGSHMIRI